MVNRIVQKLRLTGQKGLDILFKPSETRLGKWIVSVLLVVLFAVGILHWGYFLNWFNNRFDMGDWHQYRQPLTSYF